MIDWSPERIARAAGARLVSPPPAGGEGPRRAVIDSREAGPGDLFVGLPGERVNGGRFAALALAAGAWGTLTDDESAEAARCAAPGVLLAAGDPLAALQRLAREWRRELGARTIGVTGSTGKTSTKDILAALLSPHVSTVASPANLNTEIGLPLAILGAPPGTEALVLEMAMRGPGQIAELTAIARPDVGVIVNVGPVHLEILGTLEAVAAAKAELLRDLPAGATAVVPAAEPLLEPHLRDDLDVVTFGDGGDVRLVQADGERVVIDARGERVELELSYAQAHNRLNTLAAVAAALAVGVRPRGRVDVEFSGGRGDRIDLPGGVAVVDDCYNANPMSMRAALEELAVTASGRRVAVLGDMLELGDGEVEFHREVGAHAARRGVDLLITVGPRAAAMLDAYDGEGHAVADAGEAAALLPELVEPGDTVLVKASRGVGLEVVAQALAGDDPGEAGGD
ncbi:MAG: UDP-N-acetylmuramoyl-tripeptide--D-alanyl-D-alanine ligase [Solirubrobacteraceae bacterium]|jgi:UDP-N-acetylmuramoyl-tripeptide--D-alanyl-D-alanine ligase|nr:UDP-N-acetylmuramoyl-tripeptide--D-alanyl-D-alanine ligase [Solirubrobacteraceae bacterium]